MALYDNLCLVSYLESCAACWAHFHVSSWVVSKFNEYPSSLKIAIGFAKVVITRWYSIAIFDVFFHIAFPVWFPYILLPPSASESNLHLSCQLKLQEVEFISNLFLFYLYQLDLIRSPIQESLAHLLDSLTWLTNSAHHLISISTHLISSPYHILSYNLHLISTPSHLHRISSPLISSPLHLISTHLHLRSSHLHLISTEIEFLTCSFFICISWTWSVVLSICHSLHPQASWHNASREGKVGMLHLWWHRNVHQPVAKMVLPVQAGVHRHPSMVGLACWSLASCPVSASSLAGSMWHLK